MSLTRETPGCPDIRIRGLMAVKRRQQGNRGEEEVVYPVQSGQEGPQWDGAGRLGFQSWL